MVVMDGRQVGKRAARHLAAIAGCRGRRRAAHIDSVMLRDRDYSTAWTAAADSTLEERMWYGQNWRADVALVMNSYGRPLEKVKYSAYGVAMEMTNLDYNADGVIDPDDGADFIGAPYDWDLDGDVDNADRSGFATDSSTYAGVVPSRGQVSLASIGNRKGYAGYEFDGLVERYHVRHRVYVPEIGRWTRRDPIGYVDGVGLYEYVQCAPVVHVDPTGLMSCRACTIMATAVLGAMGTGTAFLVCGALGLAGGIPGLICGLMVGAVLLFGFDSPQAICEYLGFCTATGTPTPAPTTITPVDISCARLTLIHEDGTSRRECQVNCDKRFFRNLNKCRRCYDFRYNHQNMDRNRDEYGRSRLWACQMESERIYKACFNQCVSTIGQKKATISTTISVTVGGGAGVGGTYSY